MRAIGRPSSRFGIRIGPHGTRRDPPGTNGLFGGTSGDGWIYAGVAAVAFVVGIVGALSAADDIARRGGVYDLRTPLLWDMTSIAVIILLTPALLAAVRRIRRQPSWPVIIGLVDRRHRRLLRRCTSRGWWPCAS